MQDSQWPLGISHANDYVCFSVVCGNSHLHWAFHEMFEAEGSVVIEPTLLWKTIYMTQNDLKMDSTELLARSLPTIVEEWLFGSDFKKQKKPFTPLRVAALAARRKQPTIHVYLLSTTTPQQVQTVQYMFQKLPARIWDLQRKDFMDGDGILRGAYDTLGLDRMAATRAAAELHGTPTLVIDGGTALTYTALDRKGAFWGGGILPGVNMRFVALHEQTGQLPLISPEELKEAVEQRVKSNHPLPPLQRFVKSNTKDCITAGILHELADCLVGIIHRWRSDMNNDNFVQDDENLLPDKREANLKDDNAYAADAPVPVEQKQRAIANINKDLCIYVAGGDATLLSQLLNPDHSGIIEPPVRGASMLKDVQVMNVSNRLCHVAISNLISRKRNEWKFPGIRDKLVGQRIARSFPDVPDADGDIFHRATIVGLQYVEKNNPDGDWWLILFDDGQVEELQIVEVYHALIAYYEKGEKQSYYAIKGSDNDAALWASKREAVKECATLLETCSDVIKALQKKESNDADEIMDGDDATPLKAEPAAHAASVFGKQSNAETPQVLQQKRENVGVAAGTVVAAESSESPAKKHKSMPASAAKSDLSSPPTTLADCESYLNTRVCKYFEKLLYFGTVAEYLPPIPTDPTDEPFWHIVYDDGDQEDYTYDELVKCRRLYAKKGLLDPTPQRMT
ncbi:hypothetical protein MPSEU_000793000 [Mayamaea pseudoterrestris]|nr:hypothetical protein MPSEU_000793000 [Mayamaea pseudoterrestris]